MPICKEHHRGPLCSVCESGHYFAGFTGCKPCPDGVRTTFSAFGFVLSLCVLWRVAKHLRTKLRQIMPGAELARLAYEAPQILKVVVGVYQIIGSFQESFNAVAWPESYTTVMMYVYRLFSFDLFGSPVFACHSAGDTYQKRFLCHTLIVLGIAVLLGSLLLRAERSKTDDEKSKRCATFLWNILLPFLFIICKFAPHSHAKALPTP